MCNTDCSELSQEMLVDRDAGAVKLYESTLAGGDDADLVKLREVAGIEAEGDSVRWLQSKFAEVGGGLVE